MVLTLKPGQTARVMAVIVVCLLLNHVGLRLIELYSPLDCASGLFRFYCRMFTVNAEGMVPTMYSTVALLFCSLILTFIGISKKQSNASYSLHWLGLALVFLFLATDEALEIHEQFAGPVRSLLNITSGPFYFAWVIPYGVALIILVLAYLKFIVELPARTRLLFVVAGSAYVTGAMGLELLGANQSVSTGQENATYIAFSTGEEIFEMGGILIFIYALLSYAGSELGEVRIALSSD